MRIKSYYARTVEDAMAQASQELGPDAMLLNSRKAPQEALHLGVYEVVFAIDAPIAESGESQRERMKHLEELQIRHQEGPCISAFEDKQLVSAEDLAQEIRWPADRKSTRLNSSH